MKKHIYTLTVFLVTLLWTSGCRSLEDDMQSQMNASEGDNLLEAILEGKEDSRTAMSKQTGGVYKTLWSADDCIGVFIDGMDTPAQYKLINGAGATTATFKGYGSGESYVALYPGKMAKGLEGNEISLNLPSEQFYAENSFGPNSFPMVAVSNRSSLSFRNTCSVLKISMTGYHNIKSIVFKTNDEDVYVSGPATIDVSVPSNPQLKMQRGASREVTLQCNGVGLKRDQPTEFHIVLPAQTYKGGFTLTINTSTGSMTKSTTEDVVLERSQIRNLKTFTCKLDEGLEPSYQLSGKGTASSPFLIQSLGDLLLMQGAVNSLNGTILPADGSKAVVAHTAHYKLTQDISLAEVCGADKGNWEPIGNFHLNENMKFSGVFDGDGHMISDLFIRDNLKRQGLFGLLESSNKSQMAIVRNVIVKGYVKGLTQCAMIVGTQYGGSIIENCEAYGAVECKAAYAGGIVGYSVHTNAANNILISGCTNYADLNGYGYFGGIAGGASCVIKDCVNHGNIVASNDYSGGIVGYQNLGKLYNCGNTGKIEGRDNVGGISGYSIQSSKLYNCYNAGHIVGQDWVGGIIGYCDTYDSDPLETQVKNCINWGMIEAQYGMEYVGSICGLNISTVSNCYWLYDPEKGLGMERGIGITESRGKTEKCFALTQDQMASEANSSTPLYTTVDKKTYVYVLDALNAWSYDYNSVDMKLIGWEKSNDRGFPVLSGKSAEKPDENNVPVFILSQTEVNVSGNGDEFKIKVTANMDYYISSLPEWVTEITSRASIVEKEHVFQVQANPNTEKRQGVIVFCNDNQQCIPVTIVQKAKPSEENAWTEKEFWHKSLAMRFTADWCGYCPRLADAFKDAQKQKPNKIEVVHMHCDGGLKFDKSNTLANQFKVTGYPTGIVDGRKIVSSAASVLSVQEETEKKYGTQSGISFDSSVSNDQLSVQVKLYLKASGRYKVTALLLESGIIGYQADYTNGTHNDYEHNDVPRLALSNISGDAFVTDEEDVIKEFAFQGTIPSKCKRDNLRILVYVQREYGSQSVVASDNYGEYYVDNSLSEKVGVKAELKFVD